MKDNNALAATYTYNVNGGRESRTYTNGTSEHYTYNLANWLTSLTNRKGTAELSAYTYTYYADGNQRTKTDHNSRVTTYTYDGAGRLTGESETGGQAISYTYDRNSNRSGMTVSGKESYETAYAYDANNRLLTETKALTDAETVTHYVYDANGNQTAKYSETFVEESAAPGLTDTPNYTLTPGGDLYEYDGLNRMVTTFTAMGTMQYTYMANGLRYSKANDSGTTIHVWDGQQIAADVSDTGVTRYVRGVNLLKADDGNAERFYLYNAHGDVVQLTDGSGTVTKNYDYDAFGVERNRDENDSNPFRYCAEYFDNETGTVYLRARYYNPTIGRFTQQDTHWHPGNMIYGDSPSGSFMPDILAIRQSSNLYLYCTNNPTAFTDPTGYLLVSQYGAFAWQFGGVLVENALVSAWSVYSGGAQQGAAIAEALLPMITGQVSVQDVIASMGQNVWDGLSGNIRWMIKNYSQFSPDAELSDAQVKELARRTVGTIQEGVNAAYMIKGAVASAKAAYAAKVSSNAGGVCFVEGTMIATEGGLVPIEKVQVGDSVYSENPDTVEKGVKFVSQTFVRQTNELTHIKTGDEIISTTPEHPFYVPQRGWTASSELRVGDKLLLRAGDAIIIEWVEHEILEMPVTVYNFEVEDWHTYYVSDSAVLVHNACGMNNHRVLKDTTIKGYKVSMDLERGGSGLNNIHLKVGNVRYFYNDNGKFISAAGKEIPNALRNNPVITRSLQKALETMEKGW